MTASLLWANCWSVRMASWMPRWKSVACSRRVAVISPMEISAKINYLYIICIRDVYSCYVFKYLHNLERGPMRITVSFNDTVLWREFRAACIRRQTSASHEIERFVREQLQVWQQEEKDQAHD